jgi:hypothetical protein
MIEWERKWLFKGNEFTLVDELILRTQELKPYATIWWSLASYTQSDTGTLSAILVEICIATSMHESIRWLN